MEYQNKENKENAYPQITACIFRGMLSMQILLWVQQLLLVCWLNKEFVVKEIYA
jgi:hypothetical protein